MKERKKQRREEGKKDKREKERQKVVHGGEWHIKMSI